MQLGWMRVSDRRRASLSPNAVHDAALQSDELGFHQFHAARPEDLPFLPQTKKLHIGLNLEDFPQQSPRKLAETIRATQNGLEGRLVLGLSAGQSPDDCSKVQTFETLLSDARRQPLQSDFPMTPPRPEVLAMASAGSPRDVKRAAENGFHALSPAWLNRRDLARHWPAIVAGATHSARRVCPSQWHLARCIFVSDDRAAVAAYRAGPALSYLRRMALPNDDIDRLASDVVIAGSAQDVAEHLISLRKHVGPFGTLHCIDPALDADLAAVQRARIATLVLPLLRGAPTSTNKELEST